jgi:Tol biopolymer transport system component
MTLMIEVKMMPNRTRFLLIAFALIILFLSSCTGTAKIVDASRRIQVPPEKMLCVFRSDIDEEYNYEIYLLRADKGPIGENEELVLKLTATPSPAAEVFPTIARDCNTIVYCSSVNDLGTNPFFPDFDMFMIKVDTKEITPLTDTGQEREYAPSISADGNVLTFMVGSFMRGGSDLYMMYLDKPQERILIQENLGQNVFPRISADGKFAIYSAPTGATKKMDIFLVNLETREVKNLTRTPDVEEYYPDISDDMKIVTYQVQVQGAEEPIPTKPGDEPIKPAEPPTGTTPAEPETPASGDGGTLIAQAGGDEPSVSPDDPASGSDEAAGGSTDESAGQTGEQPPAQTEEGAGAETPAGAPAETGEKPKENVWNIWVMNIASGQKLQVTDNEFHDVYPVISGDGTWIVYTSAREDLNGDKQDEFLIYMYDLVAMKESCISTQPFHHDTVDISW